MIRKTDRFLKRLSFIWERGVLDRGEAVEIIRRETWWLLFVVPIYSRDTVISKPR